MPRQSKVTFTDLRSILEPKRVCLPMDIKKMTHENAQTASALCITGKLPTEIHFKFPMVSKIALYDSNIPKKSLLLLLSVIDIEKIKEIEFCGRQTKFTFRELSSRLLESPVFEAASFTLTFSQIRREQNLRKNTQQTMMFMDFAIPLRNKIKKLNMQTMQSYTHDLHHSVKYFFSLFELLEEVRIDHTLYTPDNVNQAPVAPAGVKRFNLTNKNLFECVSEKTHLRYVSLVTGDQDEKLSAPLFKKMLQNNKNTLTTVHLQYNHFPRIVEWEESHKNCSPDYYFDKPFDFSHEISQVRNLERFSGHLSFVNAFDKVKSEFEQNHEKIVQKVVVADAQDMHQYVDQIHSNKITIQQCDDLFRSFQEKGLYNYCNTLIDKFNLSDPRDIDYADGLVGFIMVLNQDSLLAKLFFERIGREKLLKYLDLFLFRVQKSKRQYSSDPVYNQEYQDNMVVDIFRITNNMGALHYTGATYEQYLYFYHQKAYRVFFPESLMRVKNTQEEEQEIEGASPKKRKINDDLEDENVVQEENLLDALPEVCTVSIFSFVDDVVQKRTFNQWMSISCVCKDWRNIYLKMLIEKIHRKNGIRFVGLPKFYGKLKPECEQIILNSNKDFVGENDAKVKISKTKIMMK